MLRAHAKLIVLVDIEGFFAPLLALLDAVVADGFAHAPPRDLVRVVERVEDVIPVLTELWAVPAPLPASAREEVRP